VAERTDVVLAALVLFTALTIAPSELAQLHTDKAEVAKLVLGPFVLLVPLDVACAPRAPRKCDERHTQALTSCER
jgi:hypothetical protein